MATRYKITLQDTSLTSGKVPVATTNGRLSDGGATSTELSYLSGVTSAIQTQINALSSVWVLISTATASASATIEFTGLSSAYKAYVLMWDGVSPATNNQFHVFRLGIGSTTWKSGASDYDYTYTQQASNNTNIGGGGVTSSIPLSGAIGNNGTAQVASGQLIIYNHSNSTQMKTVEVFQASHSSASLYTQIYGAGAYTAGMDAITGIQCYMSSGNIAVGSYYLYGLI